QRGTEVLAEVRLADAVAAQAALAGSVHLGLLVSPLLLLLVAVALLGHAAFLTTGGPFVRRPFASRQSRVTDEGHAMYERISTVLTYPLMAYGQPTGAPRCSSRSPRRYCRCHSRTPARHGHLWAGSRRNRPSRGPNRHRTSP